MKTRKLGNLGVSEMGFGCMSISANYGPAADRDQGIEVIRADSRQGRDRQTGRLPVSIRRKIAEHSVCPRFPSPALNKKKLDSAA
jgi:hypothetical protein